MPPSDPPLLSAFGANAQLDCNHNKPGWKTFAKQQHANTVFGSMLTFLHYHLAQSTAWPVTLVRL